MKLIFLLLLLLTAGCVSPWSKYPGAYIHGQCAPYAVAVNADLERRRIESYYIVYLWRSGREQGAHACVLYKTTDNRWAIVSNTECYPTYTKGTTLLAMVQSYDRNAVMISNGGMCPLPLEGRALVTSWYEKSKRRDGLMANGHRFNPDAMTCASWHYPLGTRLKVVGPLGSVIVTCTDFGPAKRLLKSRSLDLSRAAFAKICYLEAGLIEVEVTVYEPKK